MKKTRIKPVSEKQSICNQQLQRIKNDLLLTSPRCFFCGCRHNLDLVHIVRRSYCDVLKTDERNLILGCRECHTKFDSSIKTEIITLKNLDKVLDIMSELDYLYYQRFKDKIS